MRRTLLDTCGRECSLARGRCELAQHRFRGIGHDRVLFASDQPWGDYAGEFAKLSAVTGDGELARRVFGGTFADLYG